jgi:hypothetical protein
MDAGRSRAEVLHEAGILNFDHRFPYCLREVISHTKAKDLSKIFPGFRSASAPLEIDS